MVRDFQVTRQEGVARVWNQRPLPSAPWGPFMENHQPRQGASCEGPGNGRERRTSDRNTPRVQITCLPRPSPPASVAPRGTRYLGVLILLDTPRGGGLGSSMSRGFLSCINKSRGHSQECQPLSWAKGHPALQSGWLLTHWDPAGAQAPAESQSGDIRKAGGEHVLTGGCWTRVRARDLGP